MTSPETNNSLPTINKKQEPIPVKEITLSDKITYTWLTKMCGVIFNRHKWIYPLDEDHRECTKCHSKEKFIGGIGWAGWVEDDL